MMTNRMLKLLALLVTILLLTSCDEDITSVPDPPLREIFAELTMPRIAWTHCSLPADSDDLGLNPRFNPADRAFTRWHLAVPAVPRGQLDPALGPKRARDFVRALTVRFTSNDPEEDPASRRWGAREFGGILRTALPTSDATTYAVDLSSAEYLEFWLNDFSGDVDPAQREGILHFDFGFISEDFWWPPSADCAEPELGTFETEDVDGNGFLDALEDTGLDGLRSSEETCLVFARRVSNGTGDPAGDDFIVDKDPYIPGGVRLLDATFLYINGTEQNQYLDTEDLDRNGILDTREGYFRLTLCLSDTEHALVDVYRDYTEYPEQLDEFRSQNLAWRLYRIDLREMSTHIGGTHRYSAATPNLARVTYFRIWYENPDGVERDPEPVLQFADMVFGRDLVPWIYQP